MYVEHNLKKSLSHGLSKSVLNRYENLLGKLTSGLERLLVLGCASCQLFYGRYTLQATVDTVGWSFMIIMGGNGGVVSRS